MGWLQGRRGPRLRKGLGLPCAPGRGRSLSQGLDEGVRSLCEGRASPCEMGLGVGHMLPPGGILGSLRTPSQGLLGTSGLLSGQSVPRGKGTGTPEGCAICSGGQGSPHGISAHLGPTWSPHTCLLSTFTREEQLLQV